MSERMLRSLLLLLGLSQVATGAWMAFATHSFGTTIAPFDGFNEHDLRDFSTFFLALGTTLLVAVRRRQWRLPILALATLEYAFHAINHAVDATNANPARIGPADLIAVSAGAALFAWLSMVSARRPPTAPFSGAFRSLGPSERPRPRNRSIDRHR